MVQLGGHSSLRMVANYHIPDSEGADIAIKAKHGSPSKVLEDMKASALKLEDGMSVDDSTSVDDSAIATLNDIDSIVFDSPEFF